jgi:uncharacterized membrane protein
MSTHDLSRLLVIFLSLASNQIPIQDMQDYSIWHHEWHAAALVVFHLSWPLLCTSPSVDFSNLTMLLACLAFVWNWWPRAIKRQP